MKIPLKPRTYRSAKQRRTTYASVKGPLTYEPKKGEKVDVWVWHRWPCYDFIFGTPHKSSPYYATEAAFFQFRDTRLKKIMQGCYVDTFELRVLVRGFKRLWAMRKRNK